MLERGRIYEAKSILLWLSAECFITENSSLSDLELSRVFSNLSNNVFKACIKQSNVKFKSITFKSYIKDEMLMILENNTFNGRVILEKDSLKITKENPKIHGIEIEIIKQIVEKIMISFD